MVKIDKERKESRMAEQLIVDKDGQRVYHILVDNHLDNPDLIQANDNGDLQHKSLVISYKLLIMTYLSQHQKDDLIHLMRIEIMTEKKNNCRWKK